MWNRVAVCFVILILNERPEDPAAYIIQSVMADEASFNVTGLGEKRPQESPIQCVRASILQKTHPTGTPELMNVHCPLQLMRNKSTP